MPAISQEQLDSFHLFASNKLSNGGPELSLADLYNLWRIERPTPEEQEGIHAAIVEGLNDIQAGRTQPADEVLRELREKHNIPE